jgi:hypothetical protein
VISLKSHPNNELLLERMVIWSGMSGGSKNVPYHITFENRDMYNSGGCWAPPEQEARDYLQSIGIVLKPSGTYSSGWSACGCYWERKYVEPDYIPLNKNAIHLLKK